MLIPCIYVLDRMKERTAGEGAESNRAVPQDASAKKKERRTLLTGGVCCGLALFVAANLQQFGIKYTTVGKAGFITALYIVIVPVIGIFLKKAVGMKVWLSVMLAVVGLYLLCIKDGFAIGREDFLVLLCAVVFLVYILVINYFSPKVDGVRMSCIQFLYADCCLELVC